MLEVRGEGDFALRRGKVPLGCGVDEREPEGDPAADVEGEGVDDAFCEREWANVLARLSELERHSERERAVAGFNVDTVVGVELRDESLCTSSLCSSPSSSGSISTKPRSLKPLATRSA